MIDYNNIAKKYAESKGYDSVRPSVERNGYKYFYIDLCCSLPLFETSSYYKDQSYRKN